ncbi:TPA: hypothetical protein N0F65_007732 [Lagenidium giganteum]|uniref:Uncharacterized protein n=1 Tax=Lagenidium giganteum TaxID=4803 RepID=A0AAV2Z5H4_9STRA|nr:TPA: hypothetical protein N0F65_007732 [Lagenidium giganteum]
MAEEEVMTPSVPLAMEENFTHWSRFVEVPFGEDRVVSAVQDPDSFVLGTTVWDSSKTLLKYIEQHPTVFQKFSSVCELGAGCGGLAGIACAINNGGLSDLVLTDIGPVIPWLKQNVRSNLTDKEYERVRVEQYAWGTPPTHLDAPFDCILCADVVYEKDCVRPLVQSILALSNRKTVIFLANERRNPDVRDEFMRHLNEYFHWKEIHHDELDSGYLKEAIEVFEMRPKKRRVPEEMAIPADMAADADEYNPLFKGKFLNANGGDGGNDDTGSDNDAPRHEDPFERELWKDLLG